MSSFIIFLLISLFSLFLTSEAFICPPGTFTNGSTCIECPINFFSSAFNVTKCTRCPPPLTTLRPGRKSCRPCPREKIYAPRGNFACRNCPLDWVRISDTKCKKCPPGTIAPRQTSQGLDACTSCPPGWFAQRLRWRVACGPCAEGFGTKKDPMKCEPCERGYFRDIHSVYGCRPCQAGRFGNDTAMAYCTKCPPGTFQDKEGQTECKPCPEDGVSKLGAKQCRAKCGKGEPGCFFCPAGSGLNEKTGKCEKCGVGMIGQIRSVTGCFTCPSPDGVANEKRSKCGCMDAEKKIRRDGICTKCNRGFTARDCILNERLKEGLE